VTRRYIGFTELLALPRVEDDTSYRHISLLFLHPISTHILFLHPISTCIDISKHIPFFLHPISTHIPQ
jgi:hypothetical protein